MPLLNDYADSWDRTNMQLDDPAVFISPTVLGRMDTEVSLRRSLCSRIEALDAPPEVREADAEFVAACDDGAMADSYLMTGLRNSDDAALQTAIDYLYRAMDHLNRAVDLLE